MMRTVILGAGESGVGAAILARQQGDEVFLSEYGKIRASYRDMLIEYNIDFEEGKHSKERILKADRVVKSPGIADSVPIMCAILSKGIPVLSEIEFAGLYTSARMICITGSNGKTTTTSLIYHILCRAGYDVGLAGNIGHSLALQVALSPHEWYVVELSSFQLDNMYDFHTHIGVLLNITPDHLDRYDNEMQNYVDAKMRILQNMTVGDSFIYWSDDEHISCELKRYDCPARLLPFADKPANGLKAYLTNSEVCVEKYCVCKDNIGIVGLHNMRNVMAAMLAAIAAGVGKEILCESLKSFHGVAHRMEQVGEYDGVLYINDSKATNIDACRWALSAMTRPTVLIIGGRDKGNDYTTLYPLIRQHCRALVFLGADNTKLHSYFDTFGLPIADTHNISDCVEACRSFAHSGDAVLLSPCCASFDLFDNMAQRGNLFKSHIRTSYSSTIK